MTFVYSFFKGLDELIELKYEYLYNFNKITKCITNLKMEDTEKIKVNNIFDIETGSCKNIVLSKNEVFRIPVYGSKTKGSKEIGYSNQSSYNNSIIFSTRGVNAGNFNFIPGEFDASHLCGVLVASKNVYNNHYIATLLNKEAKKYVVDSGIGMMTNKDVKNISIIVPKDKKIIDLMAYILEEYYNLYNLLEEEIVKFKAIKRYYLNKIFN